MNLGDPGPSCPSCGREQGHETCTEKRIIALLTEIRDALVPPAVEDPPCPHPENLRRDMSSMGETEWICRACDFHYGPAKREKRHGEVSQHAV